MIKREIIIQLSNITNICNEFKVKENERFKRYGTIDNPR